MSQLRSMSRWIFPGAGLVTCLLFGSCGATPVPNGSGDGTGGTRNSGSMLGGSSGSTTGGSITPPGTTPTETNNCGSQQHQTTQGKADVLLVLDMSGSMGSDAVGGGTRIANLTTALNQVLPPTDSKIDWGLMVYPAVTTTSSRRGTTSQITVSAGCDPGTVVVPVAENNATNVKDFYSKLTPPQNGGYTPTAKSIANATAALQQRNSGNPKYIVLATDGLPNCPNGRVTDSTDAPAAIAAVTAAAQAGIPVYVIGMSISGSDAAAARDALNKMAEAGGRPASDGDIKYYAADTADQLVAAMNAIGGQIASCNFTLPGVPPVPNNVLVVYDDHRALPSAGTWGYTDATNTSITIYGEDCDKVMNGTYKNVQILYGCPGDAQLIP